MFKLRYSVVTVACLAWLNFLILLFCLCLPWYYVLALGPHQHPSSSLSDSCYYSLLFSWASVGCTSEKDDRHHLSQFQRCPDDLCRQMGEQRPPLSPQQDFWGEEHYTHLTSVFAGNLFLTLLATLTSLLVALFLCAPSWRHEATRSSFVGLVSLALSALTLLLVTVAMIAFAAALPSAFRFDTRYLREQQLSLIAEEGPWSSFLGQTTFEDENGDMVHSLWTPVGWWFLVLVWPFQLSLSIVLLLLWRRTLRRTALLQVTHNAHEEVQNGEVRRGRSWSEEADHFRWKQQQQQQQKRNYQSNHDFRYHHVAQPQPYRQE
ncbi:hypothetical protein QOT17_003390 [Balamuthia mandrillaris]